eukprot:gene17091-17281_t
MIRFERAKGRCEHCRRPHGQTVYHLGDGRWWDQDSLTWRNGSGRGLKLLADAPSPDHPGIRTTRVVLATAHLDHDPTNNRQKNLKALCQRCHILHDQLEHRRRRWLTMRARKALGDLFSGPYRAETYRPTETRKTDERGGAATHQAMTGHVPEQVGCANKITDNTNIGPFPRSLLKSAPVSVNITNMSDMLMLVLGAGFVDAGNKVLAHVQDLFGLIYCVYRSGIANRASIPFAGKKFRGRHGAPDRTKYRNVVQSLLAERYLRPDPDFFELAESSSARGPAFARVFRISDLPDGSAEDITALVDPFCYISHLSAMQRYGLTNRLPETLSLSTPKAWNAARDQKLTTDYPEVVRGVEYLAPLVQISFPSEIRRRPVALHRTVRGPVTRKVQDSQARIASIGETFVQMLDQPELCGGIPHVLEVWEEHAAIFLRDIIDAVDRAPEAIVKVRAGYILEERLGQYDPRIDRWAQLAQRGGSRKLDPNPVRYLERQTTGILLHAIGITPELRDALVLKGGVLMSLVHGSYRQTGDVDFTAIVDPSPYAEILRASLNGALPRAAADLGYVDMVCAVQRFEYKPREKGFADFTAPALKITIGYAKRGSTDEARLKAGTSTRVVQVDISFRERVVNASELVLDDTNVSIRAYSVDEIIAEKYRAMLQQVVRERNRRQDVFDIHWLVARYQPDDTMKAAILSSLIAKSGDRDITPTRDSVDDPEVRRRSAADWESMRLEVGSRLPAFDDCYRLVADFYRGLPW